MLRPLLGMGSPDHGTTFIVRSYGTWFISYENEDGDSAGTLTHSIRQPFSVTVRQSLVLSDGEYPMTSAFAVTYLGGSV